MEKQNQLSLDDSVKILGFDLLFPARNYLNGDQIKTFQDVSNKIKGYVGKRITVKSIDETLNTIGEHDNGWDKEYLDKTFDDQLISLRLLHPSEEQKRSIAEYEKQKGSFPGGCYWRPVVESRRVGLVGGENNYIFIKLAVPTEIDGEGSFMVLPLAKITYEK